MNYLPNCSNNLRFVNPIFFPAITLILNLGKNRGNFSLASQCRGTNRRNFEITTNRASMLPYVQYDNQSNRYSIRRRAKPHCISNKRPSNCSTSSRYCNVLLNALNLLLCRKRGMKPAFAWMIPKRRSLSLANNFMRNRPED